MPSYNADLQRSADEDDIPSDNHAQSTIGAPTVSYGSVVPTPSNSDLNPAHIPLGQLPPPLTWGPGGFPHYAMDSGNPASTVLHGNGDHQQYNAHLGGTGFVTPVNYNAPVAQPLGDGGTFGGWGAGSLNNQAPAMAGSNQNVLPGQFVQQAYGGTAPPVHQAGFVPQEYGVYNSGAYNDNVTLQGGTVYGAHNPSSTLGAASSVTTGQLQQTLMPSMTPCSLGNSWSMGSMAPQNYAGTESRGLSASTTLASSPWPSQTATGAHTPAANYTQSIAPSAPQASDTVFNQSVSPSVFFANSAAYAPNNAAVPSALGLGQAAEPGYAQPQSYDQFTGPALNATQHVNATQLTGIATGSGGPLFNQSAFAPTVDNSLSHAQSGTLLPKQAVQEHRTGNYGHGHVTTPGSRPLNPLAAPFQPHILPDVMNDGVSSFRVPGSGLLIRNVPGLPREMTPAMQTWFAGQPSPEALAAAAARASRSTTAAATSSEAGSRANPIVVRDQSPPGQDSGSATHYGAPARNSDSPLTSLGPSPTPPPQPMAGTAQPTGREAATAHTGAFSVRNPVVIPTPPQPTIAERRHLRDTRVTRAPTLNDLGVSWIDRVRAENGELALIGAALTTAGGSTGSTSRTAVPTHTAHPKTKHTNNSHKAGKSVSQNKRTRTAASKTIATGAREIGAGLQVRHRLQNNAPRTGIASTSGAAPATQTFTATPVISSDTQQAAPSPFSSADGEGSTDDEATNNNFRNLGNNFRAYHATFTPGTLTAAHQDECKTLRLTPMEALHFAKAIALLPNVHFTSKYMIGRQVISGVKISLPVEGLPQSLLAAIGIGGGKGAAQWVSRGGKVTFLVERSARLQTVTLLPPRPSLKLNMSKISVNICHRPSPTPQPHSSTEAQACFLPSNGVNFAQRPMPRLAMLARPLRAHLLGYAVSSHGSHKREASAPGERSAQQTEQVQQPQQPQQTGTILQQNGFRQHDAPSPTPSSEVPMNRLAARPSADSGASFQPEAGASHRELNTANIWPLALPAEPVAPQPNGRTSDQVIFASPAPPQYYASQRDEVRQNAVLGFGATIPPQPPHSSQPTDSGLQSSNRGSDRGRGRPHTQTQTQTHRQFFRPRSQQVTLHNDARQALSNGLPAGTAGNWQAAQFSRNWYAWSNQPNGAQGGRFFPASRRPSVRPQQQPPPALTSLTRPSRSTTRAIGQSPAFTPPPPYSERQRPSPPPASPVSDSLRSPVVLPVPSPNTRQLDLVYEATFRPFTEDIPSLPSAIARAYIAGFVPLKRTLPLPSGAVPLADIFPYGPRAVGVAEPVRVLRRDGDDGIFLDNGSRFVWTFAEEESFLDLSSPRGRRFAAFRRWLSRAFALYGSSDTLLQRLRWKLRVYIAHFERERRSLLNRTQSEGGMELSGWEEGESASAARRRRRRKAKKNKRATEKQPKEGERKGVAESRTMVVARTRWKAGRSLWMD